jgi:hypothetical protein
MHDEQRFSSTLWLLPQYVIYDEGKCVNQCFVFEKNYRTVAFQRKSLW